MGPGAGGGRGGVRVNVVVAGMLGVTTINVRKVGYTAQEREKERRVRVNIVNDGRDGE